MKTVKRIKAKFVKETPACHEETVAVFTSRAGSRCGEPMVALLPRIL